LKLIANIQLLPKFKIEAQIGHFLQIHVSAERHCRWSCSMTLYMYMSWRFLSTNRALF